MSGNVFDFELRGDDKVSASIVAINDAVAKMLPQLDKTKEAMSLGGEQTNDGLDKITGKFSKIAKNAKDSVQFIGDIVPPLKMVAGLTLGLGGVAKFFSSTVGGIKQFGDQGYHITNQAKNVSMTAKSYQELTGAMIENGIARENAEQGINQLYGRATNGLNGSDNEFIALLAQMGVQIKTTRDGVADVNSLVDDLRSSMSKLNPAKQAFFASKLGISDDMLNYLRLTTDEVKRLKDQAQRDGVIISDEDLKNALEFKNQINQINATMDGLKIKSEASAARVIKKFQTPEIKNEMERANKYGDGKLYHGDRSEDIRQYALRDESFKKKLSFKERLYLTGGKQDPELEKKLDSEYGPLWDALQLQNDIGKASIPGSIAPVLKGEHYNETKNNSLGFRNNNPGNLRSAPNEVGSDGNFAQFSSEGDGLSALSRQLQLYGDRGNNSLYGIINSYAPQSENNTQAYINDVSAQTGYSPSDKLNLHDPIILRRLMAAIISHENGTQPYSPEQIDNAVTDSITNPKWQGMRNPDALNQQLSLIGPSTTQQTSSITDGGSNMDLAADKMASAIRESLKDNKMQVEITLVNPQTGDRKTVNATGPRVTTSMNY